MMRITKRVKTQPACRALTGRMRIKPPIMPLIIPMTVRGELNDMLKLILLVRNL